MITWKSFPMRFGVFVKGLEINTTHEMSLNIFKGIVKSIFFVYSQLTNTVNVGHDLVGVFKQRRKL